MIPEDVLKKVVWQIHSFPELAGCVVGYYGDRGCRTIGYPSCVSPNSENIAVVIEEVILVGSGAAGAAQSSSRPVPVPPPVPAAVTNRSRLGPELIGAGASCALTAISAVGVFGSVAAEVPTGGASTFLLVASWSGLLTGGIQCANGLVRVGAAVADLGGVTLEQWDRNKTYNMAILFVDAVGVVGGIASLPYAVRNLWAVVTRMKSLSRVNLSLEALQRMNRFDRFRTIARVFHEASRTPEGAQALVLAAREAKVGAKTFQQASRLSVNHSTTLVKIISKETVHRLHASLRDVFGGVAGLGLSASPSELTGSGSGSINWVINLLDAGSPNF
jgi:hypothetical protein